MLLAKILRTLFYFHSQRPEHMLVRILSSLIFHHFNVRLRVACRLNIASSLLRYKMVREHVAAELGLGPTATKPWKQYFHNVIEAVYDKWDAEDEFTNSADQNLSGGSRASDKKSGKLALSAAPVEDMISDLSDVGSMDMSD